jgi:hypothetical protein
MTEKRQPAPRKPSPIKGQAEIVAPWDPCELSKLEMQAIQSLAIGEANKDQQLLFLEWFKRATNIGGMEFHPGGDRETCFASGKRFIGRLFFSLARSAPPTK